MALRASREAPAWARLQQDLPPGAAGPRLRLVGPRRPSADEPKFRALTRCARSGRACRSAERLAAWTARWTMTVGLAAACGSPGRSPSAVAVVRARHETRSTLVGSHERLPAAERDQPSTSTWVKEHSIELGRPGRTPAIVGDAAAGPAMAGR
jgi:hypothetical protein